MQIVKNLFVKAHEEGADYQRALMIYRNTPLDDNLTLPMQILQGRRARSDLPMSYAAKVKFGLASGQPSLLRPEKNERVPTHDYKLNQDVMYLDPVSNKWFPATIVRLLNAKRSDLIRTEGVEYRKHNSISSCTNQENLVYHQNQQRLVTLLRADQSMIQNHQTNLTCKSDAE